jgi:Tol biopolymer transport system component/predicted Ser/Thr protein kinase
MPLSIGDQLGSYRILASIGAGGMGEVYRAKDNKLDREVAIKVLPDALAQDPDRVARLEREAKVLASLNHPHIAQIYGIERNALVMELVQGETLQCPAPLEYAKQIAEALEAAHERGIIHRDLKPGNIMVTPDGIVKVLDFGLAFVATEKSVDPENSPTVTMGVIMGTAAYMSPEQASGKPVDKRADIWSFGVVLWEILTGKRLFAGETVSHTLADVLRGPIDFNKLPAETPQTIRELLRRCLDRDVKNRLRDLGEARVAIGRVLGGGSEVHLQAEARAIWLPWALAAVLAIVAAAGWWRAARPVAERPLIRLNAEIAPDTPLARASGGTGGNMLALSPDGSRLALTLRGGDGKLRLYTRLLNQSQVTPLADTENAGFPFFSPDGAWIGFFADGKLKKIAVEGGAAVTLCDAPAGRGGSWGDDGNIIAALGADDGLSRVPSVGGVPVPVTKLNPDERTQRWPQVLPGSKAILFTASSSSIFFDDANIDVISLKTGERKTVAPGGIYPGYLPSSTGTGYLIYLRQSTLFAAPFDLGSLSVTGSPAPVLEDVSSTFSAGGDFAFAGSPGGSRTFVYLSGKDQRAGYSISWVDSSGKTQPLHAPRGVYSTPRFSPDGKRLAFSLGNGQGYDIWVKDLDRDTPSRLSFLPRTNRWPVWTPDGKNIVFVSTNPSAPGLYWIRSDGSGEAQRLTDGKLNEVPYSISPDGKRLAFHQNGNGGSPDIFMAPIEGDFDHPKLGKVELFLGTPFVEAQPAFSPDGRWLAYLSAESGTLEVYVRPFPGPGGRWQISTGGGVFPGWSRDGRELLFETLDQRVMACMNAGVTLGWLLSAIDAL